MMASKMKKDDNNPFWFLFFIVLSILFLFPSDTFAASRYWVGGGSSANWNATAPTNWGSASNTQDNASVPGASDDVFFDGVGTGASNSTLSASISINSLDMTGYANTLTHNASVTLTIAGNTFLLSSGMTYTKGNAATSALSFTSTTGTEGTPTAITTNTKVVGNLTMNGTGGYFALQDSLSSTGSLTLTDGTFAGGSGTIDIDDGSLTVTAGVFTAPTGGMTVERNFSINGGTFNNTTVTFDDSSIADDTTVTCTGELGGTVVITKDSDGDFIVAADCSINLGADPTTIIDVTATNDFVNNGTIVIPSGTWTLNGLGGVFTNNGTTTHSGSGWNMIDASFTNVGTTTYAGTAITMERSLTQSGTFDLSGKTITFGDNNSSDDTTIACTGSLGGTVVITKDSDGDFIVAADCSINLGADPVTTIDNGAANDFVNNGTIVIPSGTWTVNNTHTTTQAIFTNNGIVTHSGSGWDFNDMGFTNASTTTYSGTAITIEGSLTQNGTFDLTGKTITFDDTSNTDDSTITCTGSLGGTVIITKDSDGDFIVAADCSINLGADPVTTIDADAVNEFTNNGTIVIPSGTWTINNVDSTATTITNAGTITHSGSGWVFAGSSTAGTGLTNNGTITYTGTTITMDGSLTQNGTFDLSGKTITFYDSSTADDSTITCTGSLGGTVVITKANNGDFIVAADCSINLGADPTTTIDVGASNDFINNGTITISSGTWTILGIDGRAIFDNNGTITHSGTGWDMDSASLVNIGTITYAGTSLSIEGSLTQSGTFDLSGKTITFDDDSSADDTAITCTGSLGGTVVITKDSDGDFTLMADCSINLGADPTTTIDGTASNDFVNNGTVVIASGTWTINGIDNPTLTNSGTITHSGSQLDLNDVSLTNSATFDLSGITVVFEGSISSTFLPSSTVESLTVNKSDSGSFVYLGGNLTISDDLTITAGGFSTEGYDLTVSGTFTNNGILALEGDEATFSVTPDTNSGSVFYLGSNPLTGLLAGDAYNNLNFLGGLIGHWKFDEGSGSTAADSSVFGRDGTLTNMDSSSDWVAGQSGTALEFDGTTEYVDLGASNTFTFRTGSTLSAWIKTSSSLCHRVVNLQRATNSTAQEIAISCDLLGDNTNDGKPLGRYRTEDNTAIATSDTAINDNQWHHLVWVIDETLGSLYVDGVSKITASDVNSTNTHANSSNIATIGSVNGATNDSFVGLIDDVRIYSRALSSTEVGELYAGGVPSGTTYTLDANLDVGGDLTISGGTLDVSTDNHSVNVAGDWANYGGFEAREGTVTLDGSSQSVLGATTFYNLTKTVSSSDTLTFEAGETQTIENALTLTGTAGNLLSLRSSTPGTQWNIDPQGTRTLSYLDVQDSNNVNSTAISANPTMANSGDNSNWGFPTSTSSGSSRTQPVTIPPPPVIPLPTIPPPNVLAPVVPNFNIPVPFSMPNSSQNTGGSGSVFSPKNISGEPKPTEAEVPKENIVEIVENVSPPEIEKTESSFFGSLRGILAAVAAAVVSLLGIILGWLRFRGV